MTVNYDSETYGLIVTGANYEYHLIEFVNSPNQVCVRYWGDLEGEKDKIERKCTELYEDIKGIE